MLPLCCAHAICFGGATNGVVSSGLLCTVHEVDGLPASHRATHQGKFSMPSHVRPLALSPLPAGCDHGSLPTSEAKQTGRAEAPGQQQPRSTFLRGSSRPLSRVRCWRPTRAVRSNLQAIQGKFWRG